MPKIPQKLKIFKNKKNLIISEFDVNQEKSILVDGRLQPALFITPENWIIWNQIISGKTATNVIIWKSGNCFFSHFFEVFLRNQTYSRQTSIKNSFLALTKTIFWPRPRHCFQKIFYLFIFALSKALSFTNRPDQKARCQSW